MSEQKRYTAQEMRELADKIWKYSDDDCKGKLELTDNDHDYVDCEATQAVIEMLRQAADAEEELDALRKATKVEVHLDGAELNAALARKVDEMRERAEELKSHLLKICGRDTCDHKGSKCICCARNVLDFVIHGDAAEGADDGCND